MRGKIGLFGRYIGTNVSFSPSSISGLVGWWDAADSATLFDSANGESQSSADGGVGRIEDKSGAGRHFRVVSSDFRPLRKTATQGGRDVIRFDGIDDMFETYVGGLSNLINPSQSTVFVVAKAASIGSDDSFLVNNQVILSEPTGGNGFCFFRTDLAGSFGFQGAWVSVYQTYAAGTWKVFTTRHGEGSLWMRINGGSESTASLSSRSSMGSNYVWLGTNYSQSLFFDGDLGEILIYNTALSTGDREAVESYLMAKWAI